MEDKIEAKETEFIWEVTLAKVDNGYILTKKSGWSGAEPVQIEKSVHGQIVDPLDDKEHNLDALQDALWTLLEFFGIYYDKHSPKNIRIELEQKKVQ